MFSRRKKTTTTSQNKSPNIETKSIKITKAVSTNKFLQAITNKITNKAQNTSQAKKTHKASFHNFVFHEKNTTTSLTFLQKKLKTKTNSQIHKNKRQINKGRN